MLTGRVPFDDDDAKAVLARVLFAAAAPPSTLNPALDRHVDDAVLRALDKDPARRWPTASAFARAIAANLAGTDATEPRATSSLHERYELGQRLGTGRLGSEVRAGRHRAIGSSVVIRILRRTAGPEWETGRTRFLREARAMQIAHPSILHVRDFGEEPDLVYVVTDQVPGSSLRQIIDEEGRLAWPRAWRFTLDLLEAGEALHRRGALVSGLNPAIVRVQDDGGAERLVVSSAGIVQVEDVLASAAADTLRALQVPSTELFYVAPEILLGEEPDGRADIYTVGVLAYEMLTGRPPFTAFTVPQLIVQIFSGAFGDLRESAPEMPPDAARAVGRCLAQRPDRRFADFTELRSVWLASAPAAAIRP
jgi:serine/threonine-protein kinase